MECFSIGPNESPTAQSIGIFVSSILHIIFTRLRLTKLCRNAMPSFSILTVTIEVVLYKHTNKSIPIQETRHVVSPTGTLINSRIIGYDHSRQCAVLCSPSREEGFSSTNQQAILAVPLAECPEAYPEVNRRRQTANTTKEE